MKKKIGENNLSIFHDTTSLHPSLFIVELRKDDQGISLSLRIQLESYCGFIQLRN